MADDRPTFGSLFAGIGGIDLGLERAGWDCRWQVEWSEWCQHNLGHHWPDVPRYGDITAVDWGSVERVDLLAGGFPCQPVSSAGRQKAQADERWLWPEFHRAIRALRPRLVLVENVTNLLAIGDGSAFGDVLGDLATSGYDTEWDCIPAAAVGALHERDRVWLVAYPGRGSVQSDGRSGEAPSAAGTAQGEGHQRQRGWDTAGDGGSDAGSLADTDRLGLARVEERNGPTAEREWSAPFGDDSDGRPDPVRRLGDAADWRMADTDSGRSGDLGSRRRGEPADGRGSLAHPDGARLEGRFFDRQRPGQRAPRQGRLPDTGEWEPEPRVGRVAHGVPARVDRLRALGNAVVPQVPEWIGRLLIEAEAEVNAA